MLGHMKKHHTDTVLLSFNVPMHLAEKVMQTMRSYGIREENESIPWREALNIKDDELSATCLRGARNKEGLTQKQLSSLCGIPTRHISEMENSKRPIGKSNARKLGEALKCEPRLLLSV